MRHLAALTLLAAAAAHADVIGQVDSGDGTAIVLDSARTVCVEPALDAAFIAKDGKRIPGCWVSGNGFVLVLFFDGDIARIPMGAVRKPEKS